MTRMSRRRAASTGLALAVLQCSNCFVHNSFPMRGSLSAAAVTSTRTSAAAAVQTDARTDKASSALEPLRFLTEEVNANAQGNQWRRSDQVQECTRTDVPCANVHVPLAEC